VGSSLGLVRLVLRVVNGLPGRSAFGFGQEVSFFGGGFAGILGRFFKGNGDGEVAFVGCFLGRFSKSEDGSDITCEELVWDGFSAWNCWN